MIKKSFTVKSPDGKFTHSFDSDWYDMTFKGGVIDLKNIPVSFDDSEFSAPDDIKNKTVKMIDGNEIWNLKFYNGILNYKKSYFFYYHNDDRFCLELSSGIYEIKQPVEYVYIHILDIISLTKCGCYFKTDDSQSKFKRRFFFCYRWH